MTIITWYQEQDQRQEDCANTKKTTAVQEDTISEGNKGLSPKCSELTEDKTTLSRTRRTFQKELEKFVGDNTNDRSNVLIGTSVVLGT